tara:strand:+ start:3936 stop:6992 length:3057 start_codon:yes stop_codon:yes gene_type:complete
MKVLRFVHSEALRLETTVGFLGDFFDRVYNEGTLPVDILNELMRFFSREWTVPMVMIPGNHDYFDATETEHGLTPFSYASKHITVLDQPTMVGDQLWIPWRRDVKELEAIIHAHPQSRVIFGHFDIVGFRLNATHTSTEGLRPSLFPEHVPVFTGHYHTPQVHGNIRYLGSPYQLSLSEAEDKKSLIVLDEHWHVSEQIPLDIGKRQYKWTANELLARSGCLRADDRVSVIYAESDTSVTGLVTTLRDRGVDVQVRRPTSVVTTRVEKQQDLGAIELLQTYASRSNIDVSSNAWQRLLERVKGAKVSVRLVEAQPVQPVRMEISGLGPFPGPLTLAMQGGGFTLVSGQCGAERGSSNGAGKSMITAGAWLWACTGHIDSRSSIHFDSDASIIHKDSECASVNVSGHVRNVPWKIMRSLGMKGRHRKHNLRLFVNSVERTRSTLSGTQKAIANELFGLDLTASELHQWLLRNSVWSQQTSGQWIDASDSQAKQDIHTLANMSIWTDLHQWCRENFRNTKEAVSLSRQTAEKKRLAIETARESLQQMEKKAEQWHAETSERVHDMTQQIEKLRTTLDATELPRRVIVNEASKQESAIIKTKLEDIRVCLAKMLAHCDEIKRNVPSDWFEKDLEKEEHRLKSIRVPNIEDMKTRQDQCRAERRARQLQLEQKQKELHDFIAKGECHACGRPFERDQTHLRHHRTLQDQLDACRKHSVNANSAFLDAQQKLIHAKRIASNHAQEMIWLQKTKSFKTTKANAGTTQAELSTLTERLDGILVELNEQSRRKCLYEKTKELRDQIERTMQSLGRQVASLRSTTCPFSTDSKQCEEADKAYCTAKDDLLRLETRLQEYGAMQKWSGSRGIQTYAMEHAVKRLACYTTDWLCKFFQTDDIEMKSFFDEKERLCRHIECPSHAGIMSGGQWRRAQLASFMAWRQMSGTNMPLLIMDEACTSMDMNGIHAVQQTFRDWCEQDASRTCFFISHEPEQHRDMSVYQNHVKILHKRGRSSVLNDTPSKRFKY